MTDSILDRVLSRKEDQEKQEFNPLEVINALFKTVSSKEADVLRRRFGLSEGRKETLENIGAQYHVTRERIRQIENQSIQKLKESSVFVSIMKPIEHLVVSLLNHHGGVMTKEMMYDALVDVHKDVPQYRQSVSFIISQLLDDKIDEIVTSKKYVPGWKLQLTSMSFVDAAIDALERMIAAKTKPQLFTEVYELFQDTDFYRKNDQRLTEDAVLSYLDISAKIGRNPFDEYGLAVWGLIYPKRMNDRVYLVLQKEGKPLHFEEIARRVEKIFKKNAYPPTVHNELILNGEYVLVGRGMYALKEWGFKEGVVSDVIVDILKKSARPLDRSEIVAQVLQQRIVKKNTIHLALTDKTVFHKTKDGKYQLNGDTAAQPPPAATALDATTASER